MAAFAFGEDAARGHLVAQIGGLVGDQAARAVQDMVENASREKESGVVASAVGPAMLLFGASGSSANFRIP